MLIEKYTRNWIVYFTEIKLEIEKALSGLEHQIEHIGSTSVPNLDSKPIIDIDIIFSKEEEFHNIKSALLNFGYDHYGNQGITNREVFKRNGKSANRILDSITHHLYVCKQDSPALERHILFRDFLKRNEWAKIKYQEMKYELADRANQNKKLYAELKELHVNRFIDEILEKEKRIK